MERSGPHYSRVNLFLVRRHPTARYHVLIHFGVLPIGRSEALPMQRVASRKRRQKLRPRNLTGRPTLHPSPRLR